MSQEYFRFKWMDDKDNPNRFQPAANGTSITVGEPVPMIFVPTVADPADTSWDLEGAGYYRFVLDPLAKTVTVTKPVIVTGVSITGGDIPLVQGTVDHPFIAVVQGHNVVQEVTWTVSSEVSGTEISADGKLTIAEAEPVGTLTIMATSKDNPAKSASVTVTVVSKDAEELSPPTNVTLSGEGVAEWTASSDDLHVVRYSVQLYKDTNTVGNAKTVNQGGEYSVPFLSDMRNEGAGSYTVKVKAVGDEQNYSDSEEAVSASPQTVSLGLVVQTLNWFETSKAQWVNVDGGLDYTVQLYKNGSESGSAVPVTRYDGANTTHDFTGDIISAGAGTYTFRVITKGDDRLVLDSQASALSSGYSYIPVLPTPGKPTLSTGVVTWSTVSGAVSYTVKLYKDGSGIAVETYTNQTSGSSVLSDMRAKGAGLYTVTVTAIGNETDWLSSDESAASDSETVALLDIPSGLEWEGTNAKWTADTNAASYTVKLYKGDELADTITEASSPEDLADKLARPGLYTFTVQAIGGTSTLYLDGGVSTASDGKRVGGTASITLAASEKWSGTLTGGEATTIARSDGTLTVSVTGSDFVTFVWIVDGDVVAGPTGSSIILTGSDYALGGHSVTVYALDGNNAPWSPSSPITFTVTAN
jgi:hypothetical protein